VDGVGTIKNITKDDNAIIFDIGADASILRYIVEKGSITVDGISLTVASVSEGSFTVSVIPHTAKETTLGAKKTGDPVNLENDMVGKYVEKLLYHGTAEKEQTAESKSKLTKAFLIENGF
jgi:riboflavin synthase